jgi:hypothetical protein
MLFVVALTLVLAWKTAGYLGLDYWLLPLLGVPWHTPEADEFERKSYSPPPATQPAPAEN